MQQVYYFFDFTLAVQALDSRITPSIDLPYRINSCTHTDAIRQKS